MGAAYPESTPEAMRPYQRAKGKADDRVRASALEWTFVRPGGLTDHRGRGTVDVAPELGRGGEGAATTWPKSSSPHSRAPRPCAPPSTCSREARRSARPRGPLGGCPALEEGRSSRLTAEMSVLFVSGESSTAITVMSDRPAM